MTHAEVAAKAVLREGAFAWLVGGRPFHTVHFGPAFMQPFGRFHGQLRVHRYGFDIRVVPFVKAAAQQYDMALQKHLLEFFVVIIETFS